MLKLTNISKDYKIGDSVTHALVDINLEFPSQQFVSILGQSGSGKTTLLNLIGGLDKYTRGDLSIQGMSTKEFKDSDWDAYRNEMIGFVFQNYNLIPHLSVLDNVEIALTLSGVSPSERRNRAKKVLTDVGIADQMYKRPNTLSGGQMQRVAIARALVNNPKIILADEPTGAIDSKTSIQIMELIKQISKDRLVIMVTHNDELAKKYSNRIIHLLDGKVIEDNAPYHEQTEEKRELIHKTKKTSMSFLTALKSSFKNLISKKTRTVITAIAGSIGIIGIALVLSISAGMTYYVNSMQSDTLAGFPLTINQVVNVSSDQFNPQQRISEATGQLIDADAFPDEEIIFSYDYQADLDTHTNLFTPEYLQYINNMDPAFYNSISISYGVRMNVVAQNTSGAYQLANTTQGSGLMALFSSGYFNEIPNSRDFIETQYDLLGSQSKYPTEANEIALIVDSKNRVNVDFLNDFGIAVEDEYSFSDFIGKSFSVIENNDFYHQFGSLFLPNTDYETMAMQPNTYTITIVGIMRVKESASSELLSTGIGYTTKLTERVLENASTSDIVVAQTNSPTVNVLSGTPFNDLITYDSVIQALGGDSRPTGIQIYPVSFDTKDQIKAYLDEYNALQTDDADKMIYSDLAETISNTISSLINTITVILSAFAAISLVVSSIMIGIITYVSVVERTKEIGIMRSIGARKKDIARIFNAETVLIGFAAGVIGILSSLLIIIPINLWIGKLTAVAGFARLPIFSAIGLIVISVALTFIAGLVPSGIAARRDPVVALRTE